MKRCCEKNRIVDVHVSGYFVFFFASSLYLIRKTRKETIYCKRSSPLSRNWRLRKLMEIENCSLCRYVNDFNYGLLCTATALALLKCDGIKKRRNHRALYCWTAWGCFCLIDSQWSMLENCLHCWLGRASTWARALWVSCNASSCDRSLPIALLNNSEYFSCERHFKRNLHRN